MDDTKVMVEFIIGGDGFSPVEITNILKIEPTETGIKGESLLGGKHKRIENFWEINNGYESSLDINDQIFPIFKAIENKKEELKLLLNKPSIYGKFIIVVRVEQGQFPAMYLKKEFIKFMADVGLEIGFDMYYFS